MDIVNLNIRVPKELRTDFQIYAKRHDTTVTALLIKHMEDLLNENE